MPDGAHTGSALPASATGTPPSHTNPARRRIIRSLAVLAPLVVPVVMGLVVMLVLR